MARKALEIKRSLTREEAEFVYDLFTNNRKVITRVISIVLGEQYEFLINDCIIEVCIIACKKIDALKLHNAPEKWIVAAAKNVALNMVRSQYKYQREFLAETVDNQPVRIDIFEEVVYNDWIKNDVPRKLIASLTASEREVYDLIYVQQKTTKEAAAIREVSESTIRNINKSLRDKIEAKIRNHDF